MFLLYFTMDIDIKKTENWILIENKFLFNPTTIGVWIINLLPKIWEEMAYERWNLFSIDFPWEYDIGWAFIKVYVWNMEWLYHPYPGYGHASSVDLYCI